MIADHRHDYPSDTALAAGVASKLNLGRETVRRWLVQADIQRRGPSRHQLQWAGRAQEVEGGEQTAARGHPAAGNGFLRPGTRPAQPLTVTFIDDIHSEQTRSSRSVESGVSRAARSPRAPTGP